MIERDILLNGAAALLLLSLSFHFPPLARRLGRGWFLLLGAGSLLPLLDPLVFFSLSADRIEILVRNPLLAAPLNALLLIAAGMMVGAFLFPGRMMLRMGAGLAGGYLLQGALALVTPLGVPLLAPYSPVRFSLPLFPVGHAPLLLVSFLALAILESLPRGRRWVLAGSAGLIAVYLAAGPLEYVLVSRQASGLAEGKGQVHIYPDGSWLLRWRIVVEMPEAYQFSRYRVGRGKIEELRYFQRWNDQALFLKLADDPVVRRFYYQVFRHPVVNLDRSGSQITLLMQELEHQSPPVPGPTFYLESDRTGRNRFYQLQRFN